MGNDFKRGIRVYLESSDYGKGIDQMVAATKKYEKELEDLTQKSKEMTAAGNNSGKAWDDMQVKMKRLEAQTKKSKAAEEDYRAKLQQTEKVLSNLSGHSYNELVDVQKKLQKELKATTRGTDEHKIKLEQYERVTKEVGAAQKEMNSNLGSSESGWSKAANGINKYMGIGMAAIAAITGLSLGLKKFMDMRKELEDSQANLKSLTGLGDTDIIWLTEQAKLLSTTTTEAGIRITASSKEIMDGFTTIGSKRPELLKNKEAMKQVTEQALILAAAGKMDVATAFDVVTASMNQFNLGAGESNRIINTIAAGSLEGSAEADSLAGSLKNVGTVAKGSNMSLEQTVAALEVLASKQLMGEEAGTKLRGALLKMKDAGVGYTSGIFNMRDAIIEVNSQMDKKGSALERDALLAKVFGAENITAGQILLENVDQYDKLTKAVTGTNVAMDQAKTQTETTSAKLKQAQNRFNELGMELVDGLNPAMLSATNFSTNFLRILIQLPGWLKENGKLLITLTLTIGAYTVAVNASTIATKANELATKAIDSSVIKFFKTLLTNPYVAIGTAIAVVTVAIYTWITATTLANKVWKEFNEQSKSEISIANQLFESLKKTNSGSLERKILLEKINSKYGEYLGYQLKDTSSLQDIKKAQDELNVSMKETLAIKMRDEAKSQIIKESTEKQIDELEKMRKTLGIVYSKDQADVATDFISQIVQKNEGKGNTALKQTQDYLEKWLKRNYSKVNADVFLKDYFKVLNQAYNEQYAIDKKFSAFISKPKPTVNPIDGDKNGKNPKNGPKTLTDEELQKLNAKRDKRFNADLEALDISSKKSLLLIMEQRRNQEITEDVFNKKALDIQLKFLEDKKTLQKKYGKQTVETEIEISNQNSKIQKAADDAALQSIKDIQNSGIAALESAQLTKQNMLQDALNKGIIKEREYNSEIKKLAVELALAKLKLAEASLQSLEKVQFNDKETQKKALEEAIAQITKLKEALVKAQGDVAKDTAKEVEKNAETVAERMSKIFGKSFSEIGLLFKNFYEGLDKFKAGDLDSWDDWAAAIGGIVEGALAVATQVNNEYFAGKAAELEADKQRELTNAGDNAEARDAINQKYAQKELDLKKKQSSADTVLKVAQAVAAGGLAIVQAFAQLGPIGGAVAAVLVGGTTALQIKTILAQNDAIQNTTLDSSGSGGAAPASTGARVVNQAAEGRWDVMGADDGRVYRNVPYRGVARTGMITSPTLVGEQGTELIVDNPTLRNLQMNAPHVLDTIRTHRVRQRADGNFAPLEGSNNSSSTNNSSTDNGALITAYMEIMNRVAILLDWLATNRIEAYTILSEFEKKRDLRDKSISKGSLK